MARYYGPLKGFEKTKNFLKDVWATTQTERKEWREDLEDLFFNFGQSIKNLTAYLNPFKIREAYLEGKFYDCCNSITFKANGVPLDIKWNDARGHDRIDEKSGISLCANLSPATTKALLGIIDAHSTLTVLDKNGKEYQITNLRKTTNKFGSNILACTLPEAPLKGITKRPVLFSFYTK